MVIILSSNCTQHDSYGVFRLQVGVFVGKARDFMLGKSQRNYSNIAKKLNSQPCKITFP